MGRVMTCTPLYKWTGNSPIWAPPARAPLAWEGQLTQGQREASDRIIKAIETKQAELLIHAVCGAGKTEMLFEGIALAITQQKRVCLTSPRADVIRELLPRFKQAFPNTTIVGLYGGSGKNHQTAQLTLATTHQLLRYEAAFDLIIIDELDAFPYHADPSLPYATQRARKPTATMIYLTATPRQELLKRQPPTVFVPVRYHGHPLPVPRLLSTYKFIRRELPNCFWSWFNQRQNKSRQLLIFIATISQADELLPTLIKKFPDKNVAAVHAEDSDRIEKVQQFRNKQIDILFTTTILERGVTFPSVDVAVIDAGHQVFDQAALVQIAGRAGRSPEDPTGDIVFIHDGKTRAIRDSINAIKVMNKRAGFH
ncbi:DEAD/DEAH box helicase [Amphibacillus sp. Q70]|uniref:DEAD/DEAH box helicase n=1 Tax=Amphibacillus sp. Q70 TaxID=3453416 RepID=UPI003F841DCC